MGFRRHLPAEVHRAQHTQCFSYTRLAIPSILAGADNFFILDAEGGVGLQSKIGLVEIKDFLSITAVFSQSVSASGGAFFYPRSTSDPVKRSQT